MRRIAWIVVAGIFGLFGGLAGCDKGGSEKIDDCQSLVDQMKEFDEETSGSFEEEEKMGEMCKEANLIEKHEETIDCLNDAANLKEAEKCDGVQQLIMSWGTAGMEGG